MPELAPVITAVLPSLRTESAVILDMLVSCTIMFLIEYDTIQTFPLFSIAVVAKIGSTNRTKDPHMRNLLSVIAMSNMFFLRGVASGAKITVGTSAW